MEHLRELRKQNGMTLGALGKKVGVSLKTIFNYETGKRKPNIEMLRKLAKSLDCTIGDLLGE